MDELMRLDLTGVECFDSLWVGGTQAEEGTARQKNRLTSGGGGVPQNRYMYGMVPPRAEKLLRRTIRLPAR